MQGDLVEVETGSGEGRIGATYGLDESARIFRWSGDGAVGEVVLQAQPAARGLRGSDQGDHAAPGPVGRRHAQVRDATAGGLVGQQVLHAEFGRGVEEQVGPCERLIEGIDVGVPDRLVPDDAEPECHEPGLDVWGTVGGEGGHGSGLRPP